MKENKRNPLTRLLLPALMLVFAITAALMGAVMLPQVSAQVQINAADYENMDDEQLDSLVFTIKRAMTEGVMTPDDLSWSLIDVLARRGRVQEVLSVGDEKTEMFTTGEEVTFVVMGFDHDDWADGSGKAPITWGMKNLLSTKHGLNTSNTNAGGWAASEMRNITLPAIFETLPQELRDVIKPVSKKSTVGGSSTEIQTTADDLFLFSKDEIFSDAQGLGEGVQYENYLSNKNSTNGGDMFVQNPGTIKHLDNGNGAADYWLLRSVDLNNPNYACYVSQSGFVNYYNASYAYGVCFGFSMGAEPEINESEFEFVSENGETEWSHEFQEIPELSNAAFSFNLENKFSSNSTAHPEFGKLNFVHETYIRLGIGSIWNELYLSVYRGDDATYYFDYRFCNLKNALMSFPRDYNNRYLFTYDTDSEDVKIDIIVTLGAVQIRANTSILLDAAFEKQTQEDVLTSFVYKSLTMQSPENYPNGGILTINSDVPEPLPSSPQYDVLFTYRGSSSGDVPSSTNRLFKLSPGTTIPNYIPPENVQDGEKLTHWQTDATGQNIGEPITANVTFAAVYEDVDMYELRFVGEWEDGATYAREQVEVGSSIPLAEIPDYSEHAPEHQRHVGWRSSEGVFAQDYAGEQRAGGLYYVNFYPVFSEAVVEILFEKTEETMAMFDHIFSSIILNKHFDIVCRNVTFNTDTISKARTSSLQIVFRLVGYTPADVTTDWAVKNINAEINGGIWEAVKVRYVDELPEPPPPPDEEPPKPEPQEPSVGGIGEFFANAPTSIFFPLVGVIAGIIILIAFIKSRKRKRGRR
jgi:hypothetical protein